MISKFLQAQMDYIFFILRIGLYSPGCRHLGVEPRGEAAVAMEMALPVRTCSWDKRMAGYGCLQSQ